MKGVPLSVKDPHACSTSHSGHEAVCTPMRSGWMKSRQHSLPALHSCRPVRCTVKTACVAKSSTSMSRWQPAPACSQQSQRHELYAEPCSKIDRQRQLCSGLTVLCSMLLAAAPALAEEAIAYQPTAGGDVVKNLAGVAYLGLVLFFVVRLLSKRAKTATEEARLLPASCCGRFCRGQCAQHAAVMVPRYAYEKCNMSGMRRGWRPWQRGSRRSLKKSCQHPATSLP